MITYLILSVNTPKRFGCELVQTRKLTGFEVAKCRQNSKLILMNRNLLTLIFIILVFILGALLYIYNPEPVEYKSPDQKIACTMEAKLCPDGSYVGRVGPDCEFAPCPEPKPE